MKFYSLKGTAELIGVSVRTMQRYVRDGVLQGAKFGREWRFTEDDIMRAYETIKADLVEDKKRSKSDNKQ